MHAGPTCVLLRNEKLWKELQKVPGKRRSRHLFFPKKRVGSQERNPKKCPMKMGKESHLPTAQLDMLVPQQGGPQELDEGEELDEEERKALGGPG